MDLQPRAGGPGKPRVCGDDPSLGHQLEDAITVNPACAGMIPTRTRTPLRTRRKPRVCGDDPTRLDAIAAAQG